MQEFVAVEKASDDLTPATHRKNSKRTLHGQNNGVSKYSTSGFSDSENFTESLTDNLAENLVENSAEILADNLSDIEQCVLMYSI